MNNSVHKYRIWLEVDEYNIELDKRFNEEYCNAIIYFSNGTQIGLNVWSEKYLLSNLNNLDWIDEEFATLPDIIVKNYQASSIRKAIINLIEKENWLQERGFPYNE